jgi:LacI family transcriptional regulator
MRIAIAVFSTFTFSSRFLAGFLAYCRDHPVVRPRIIRLGDRAEIREHIDDLEGEAVVLDLRFRELLDAGWRPRVPGIVQAFLAREDLDFPQVGFNNEAIGREAARRLAEEGLRQLLFVGNRDTESSPYRWRGFKAGGEELGLPVAFFGDGPRQRGRKKILLHVQMADLVETLKSIGRPVGVFANDDNRGERVLEAAEAAGLNIPRDVAVCCVSSTPMLCEWTRPTLSAFNLDHEAQGRMAAEWARRAVECGPPPAGNLIAPWRFVERESSSHLRQSDPLVARALRYMDERLKDSPGVAEVARAAHTSKRTLERRFRTVLNHGPAEAFRDLRMRATLDRLAGPGLPLKTIAVETGWADASQMGRAVKQATGLTPARYRLEHGRLPSA